MVVLILSKQKDRVHFRTFWTELPLPPTTARHTGRSRSWSRLGVVDIMDRMGGIGLG